MNPAQKDPLALDVINERRLVAAFLDFLRTKGQKSDTSENVRAELERKLNILSCKNWIFEKFFRSEN